MKLSPDTKRLLATAGAATLLVGGVAGTGYTIADYERRAAAAAREGTYVEPPLALEVYDFVREKMGMRRLHQPPCGMCGMG